MKHNFSPSDVVALYRHASPFSRFLIAGRPYICPMQPLLDAGLVRRSGTRKTGRYILA